MKKETKDFWATINEKLTKKEREALNRYSSRLYQAALMLKDDIDFIYAGAAEDDHMTNRIFKKSEKVMDVVCEIPQLCGD